MVHCNTNSIILKKKLFLVSEHPIVDARFSCKGLKYSSLDIILSWDFRSEVFIKSFRRSSFHFPLCKHGLYA